MSDNRRQSLVTALLSRLATITTANGYDSNLGAHTIGEWRGHFEKRELPAISLKDAVVLTDPPANRRSGLRERRLRVVLELYFADSATPEEARIGISDVLVVIGKDPTFGGDAEGTERVSESLVVDEELTWLNAAQIVVEIIYFEPVW